jgi:hypothetical protein
MTDIDALVWQQVKRALAPLIEQAARELLNARCDGLAGMPTIRERPVDWKPPKKSG